MKTNLYSKCLYSNIVGCFGSALCWCFTIFSVLIFIIPILTQCLRSNRYTPTECKTISSRLSTESHLSVCGLNCVYDEPFYRYLLTIEYNASFIVTTDIYTSKNSDLKELKKTYPMYIINSTFTCYYDIYNLDNVYFSSYKQMCLPFPIIFGILLTISSSVYLILTILSFIVINRDDND